MKSRQLIVAAAAALLLGGNGHLLAQPQTSGTTPPPPPRHGLLRLRHPRPTVGSPVPISGGIIGNKRTHVYHLPGDTGNMPATKNRVYFRSETEARTAGYHAARKRSLVPTPHRRLPGIRRTRTSPLSPQQPNTTPTTPTPN